MCSLPGFYAPGVVIRLTCDAGTTKLNHFYWTGASDGASLWTKTTRSKPAEYPDEDASTIARALHGPR